MNEILHKVTFNPEDGCNVPDEVIIEQVKANIRRQLPQAYPHAPNEERVALVCGGPSLRTTERDLINAYWNGAKVIALNGSYQWCIDRNIRPSCMVMLDAREFNARFVATPVEKCRYLLAAQCHPVAFELCKDRDVTIWHCCSGGQPEMDLLKQYYFNRFNPITGGTTVAIRAILLLTMLGFRTFDIFGLDSCWMDDDHHGYAQPENDDDMRLKTWLRPEGREDLWCSFMCAPWMMRQAVDFQALIHEHGDKFRLNVRGKGLIAAIMRIAAELGTQVSPEIGD
jgi:hypothetical protein